MSGAQTYRDPAYTTYRREVHRRARRSGFDPTPLLPTELGWPRPHAGKDRQRDFKRLAIFPDCSALLAAVIEGTVGADAYTAAPRRSNRRARGRTPPRTEEMCRRATKSERRLRRHPPLHHGDTPKGAGARPHPRAMPSQRRGARCGPGTRAGGEPPDRSGVGRHVPILRQADFRARIENLLNISAMPCAPCAGAPGHGDPADVRQRDIARG